MHNQPRPREREDVSDLDVAPSPNNRVQIVKTNSTNVDFIEKGRRICRKNGKCFWCWCWSGKKEGHFDCSLIIKSFHERTRGRAAGRSDRLDPPHFNCGLCPWLLIINRAPSLNLTFAESLRKSINWWLADRQCHAVRSGPVQPSGPRISSLQISSLVISDRERKRIESSLDAFARYLTKRMRKNFRQDH